MVEESMKEMDINDIGIQMDAALEQNQADCQLEGMIEHPDYMHMDTEGIEVVDNRNINASIFKKIEIPSLAELKEETRKLDKFQR